MKIGKFLGLWAGMHLLGSCASQHTASEGPSKLPPIESRVIFAVNLKWQAGDRQTAAQLIEHIDQVPISYMEAFDPDCFYRPDSIDGQCAASKNTDTVEELDEWSERAKKETRGYFEVKVLRRHKLRRDFAGLSQGFFLEKLKHQITGSWVGDFSGDIFFTGAFIPTGSFTLGEPRDPHRILATVHMKSGWMLASTSRTLVNEMRNPKFKNPSGTWPEDFLRVVLFAKTSFAGPRLDAWSTAIIPGGQKLINHLESFKEFQGDWAYAVVTSRGEFKCSANLKCEQSHVAEAPPWIVTTPW